MTDHCPHDPDRRSGPGRRPYDHYPVDDPIAVHAAEMAAEKALRMYRDTQPDEDTLHRVAREAAKTAVSDLTGVDASDAAAVEEFRKDLRFNGQLRKAADKGFIAAVTTGLLVILGAGWLALADHFPGKS